MSETNTKKRTERGSFDEGISPEHKVTCVIGSPSAEVESPATLEMDEPSLGDIHQVLIEVQGTIEQLLKTSFQPGGLKGVPMMLRVKNRCSEIATSRTRCFSRGKKEFFERFVLFLVKGYW